MSRDPDKLGGQRNVGVPAVDMIASAHERATRRMAAVQRTPVGKRIVNVIRNLAWVVPLTVLVWLYAEREQIDRQRGLTVPIKVTTERTDRVVSIVRPEDRTVMIDIEGTRARIEQARQEIAATQGLDLVIPANTPVGTQVPVPLLEAIATSPVFASRGIVVTACNPSTFVLNVDEVVSNVELRPTVSKEVAARLAGPIEFDPPVVRATGPRGVLMSASKPEVVADITEQMIPKVPGVHSLPNVSVRLAKPNDEVKLAPVTVTATVRVRSSTVTYVHNAVPIFVLAPPALLEKYRVVFPGGNAFIPRITLIGPEDQINRIKSNEFIPTAVLQIRPEDARERLPRAPYMYILPPDVSVSEEDLKKTIAFELEERSRAE